MKKNNPQADVWFGGPFDTHLQAVELGLVEPYSSQKLAEVLPQFKNWEWKQFCCIHGGLGLV